ncbi:helix-turn-helix domain-containing protein [Candidatus Allofournierella merdipullorum]|uniref:helix-turn-helix domain-containing protein n=1 Tax=Candidatus Allofournierella merdipullorum TaxID=2838595 RepID=UPI002A8E62B2|nr:helix-turn-helix transcriptional regulator [Candidatus Fournierella merdipullorum]
MTKELLTMAERIKFLREKLELTQAEIARRLGISRAGVNAWEMGLSVPSTQYVVELAKIFGVSTDYLLGMGKTAMVSVEGLSEKQVAAVVNVIECFRAGN